MAQHRYAYTGTGNVAQAVGRDLPISTKVSIELCNALRHKHLDKAEQWLNQVVELKAAMPMRRFIADRGHKTRIGPGRYPVKASLEVLKLIHQVRSNAQNKGMNPAQCEIVHICCQKASRPGRMGRIRGIHAKRTHVEIVVKEAEKKQQSAKKHDKKVNA